MDSTGTGPDVDVVLNTREFVNYLRSLNIDIYSLPEDDFDSPCGEGSGAGVIYGATGGVMEAALRTCYNMATGENPEPDAFYGIRGMDGWREASIDIAGTTVKVAVVTVSETPAGRSRQYAKARSSITLWKSWPVRAAA